jgi:crotonobetainyl-CoA:carnitine CoA-transferase CaiB-like acyl-CoA transferase
VIYNDKQWHSFLGVIARPDLRTSPIFSSHTARAANTNEVYSFVADVMTTRTCSEWILELERADVPVARLHTKESLLEDPHLNAVAFYPEYDHPSEGRIRTVAPVGRYSATSVGIHRHAPRIGEHSVEILKEAGLDHAKINQMMLSGATVQAGPISAAAPMSNRDEPG